MQVSTHLGWRRRVAHRLLRDERGIAATEFALIAPVFILMIMAMFDMAHMTYARATFDGIVQRAARASSLETADTAAADTMVYNNVKILLPAIVRSDMTTTRMSYYDFADIKRPEKLEEDKNNNGECNTGDKYLDENNNNTFDKDIGKDGNGGAGDVVMYTATIEYKPVLRVPFLPSAWSKRKLTATAVKKNQPFANQTAYSSTKKTC